MRATLVPMENIPNVYLKLEAGDVVHLPQQPGVQLHDSRSTEAAGTTPPFSIFTPREKQGISSLGPFGAMFPTLNSYIYFPALVPMASDLSMWVALINLTVTSYLVVAGVAPACTGDLVN